MHETCTRCDRPVLAGGLCPKHYYSREEKDRRRAIREAPRPCVICGASLEGKIPTARFCSDRCRQASHMAAERTAARERRDARICVSCGGPVIGRSGKAETCSEVCSQKWRNDRRQAERRSRWEATTPTCQRCGKDIAQRQIGSVYCSTKCKRAFLAARWRERAPGYMRHYLYGLEPAQYDALLASQDGRCAICRTDDPHGKGTWHVDHDHATGQVRGLLCHNCNLALGNFRDDPVRLRAAVAYLER